jgi:hypothetical protein
MYLRIRKAPDPRSIRHDWASFFCVFVSGPFIVLREYKGIRRLADSHSRLNSAGLHNIHLSFPPRLTTLMADLRMVWQLFFLFVALADFAQPTGVVMLRARAYFCDYTEAKTVLIPATTHAQSNTRQTLPQTLHRDSYYQSKIHDVVVRVPVGRKCVHFRIFFKRHARLPVNQILPGLTGHFIVARVSASDPAFQSTVNLQKGDTRLIHRILERYALRSTSFTRSHYLSG